METVSHVFPNVQTIGSETCRDYERGASAKSGIVDRKFKTAKLTIEQKANNRFELTEKFLKTNITNAELANEGIPEDILREFKKVGSNF